MYNFPVVKVGMFYNPFDLEYTDTVKISKAIDDKEPEQLILLGETDPNKVQEYTIFLMVGDL